MKGDNMTKQEEIKEGINRIIAVSQSDGCFGYTKESDANFMSQYAYIAKEIVCYLHSQGVVIKVDRELDFDAVPILSPNGKPIVVDLPSEVVAVEPLIKEKKNESRISGN